MICEDILSTNRMLMQLTSQYFKYFILNCVLYQLETKTQDTEETAVQIENFGHITHLPVMFYQCQHLSFGR